MNRYESSGIGVILWVMISAVMLPVAGCVLGPDADSLDKWVAPSADHVWTPPEGRAVKSPPSAKGVDIPEELLKAGAKWRLTVSPS